MQEMEEALDGLLHGVHDALQHYSAPGADGDLDHMLCGWMQTLHRVVRSRLAAADDENSDDLDEEVLDVVATLLRTCASSQWRAPHPSSRNDAYAARLFKSVFLQQCVELMGRFLATASSELELNERLLIVGDVIASAAALAVTAEETETVLQALKADEVLMEQLATWRPRGDNAIRSMDDTTRRICFSKFLAEMMAIQAPVCSIARNTHIATHQVALGKLTGSASTEAWIQSTWETKWHVNKSNCVAAMLLNASTGDYPSHIRRILDGFSIPSIPADRSEGGNLANMLVDLRIDDILGLQHGEDVTLIKYGIVHPKWAASDGSDRCITCQDTMDALADGYTIGVRGMQARCPSVYSICNALQRELGQYVNANLYWTPRDQQGFNIHIDDHCVFAIQMKGRKRWFLYKQQGDVLPSLYDNTEAILRSNTMRAEPEVVVMDEGDVLYIPRGVPHYAETSGMPNESIHLTLGVEIERECTKSAAAEMLTNGANKLAPLMSASLSRTMSQGLMAWHLESSEGFQSVVTEWRQISTDRDPATGRDPRNDTEAARRKLIAARSQYISARLLHTRAMATLHHAFGVGNAPPRHAFVAESTEKTLVRAHAEEGPREAKKRKTRC